MIDPIRDETKPVVAGGDPEKKSGEAATASLLYSSRPLLDPPRLGVLIILLGVIAVSGLLGLLRLPFVEKASAGVDLSSTGALIFMALAAFIIFAGIRVVVSGAIARQEVIPERDRRLLEPLIAAGDDKAIDQYVRLSSLSGGTGLATKLGLTGLPLLTVALTLIFSGLELYKPSGGFLDLAKLSLGAFIGSFVQRVATTQTVAPTGKVPPVV